MKSAVGVGRYDSFSSYYMTIYDEEKKGATQSGVEVRGKEQQRDGEDSSSIQSVTLGGMNDTQRVLLSGERGGDLFFNNGLFQYPERKGTAAGAPNAGGSSGLGDNFNVDVSPRVPSEEEDDHSDDEIYSSSSCTC